MKDSVVEHRVCFDRRQTNKNRLEYGSKPMTRIIYIGCPRYLSDPILSSIAVELKGRVENIYMETNEKPGVGPLPPGFGWSIEINKKLVSDVYDCIRNRKIKDIIRLIETTKILRREVDSEMNRLKPDAIIATSDMGGVVMQMCDDWAVKNRKPFFIMQPCLLELRPETLKNRAMRHIKYTFFNKILNAPIGRRKYYPNNERDTDFILLWSEEFANQMKHTKNTFYVGNPCLDKFADKEVKEVNKKPTVLICAQPYNKMVEMGLLQTGQDIILLEMLVETVTQNPNIKFIIRIHPSDNIEDYVKLFYNLHNVEIIKTTASIYDTLETVDVQVSQSSYTSFESIVAGVPIIVIHPEFTNHNKQFEGIGQTAKSAESLNYKLKVCLRPTGRIVFKSQRKEYLEKKLSYFGYSAEITGKTILRIIAWKK
jgi:hypothetical protein